MPADSQVAPAGAGPRTRRLVDRLADWHARRRAAAARRPDVAGPAALLKVLDPDPISLRGRLAGLAPDRRQALAQALRYRFYTARWYSSVAERRYAVMELEGAVAWAIARLETDSAEGWELVEQQLLSERLR
jgi:hypothetical protein